MNIKPILFSTSMVQAILAARKTQTRRLNGLDQINEYPDNWKFKGLYDRDLSLKKLRVHCAQLEEKAGFIHNIPCPYGKPGDILWVRESFNKGENGRFHYKAEELGPLDAVKWKPSIHMTKEACRLFLKIKSVRVERLHDITKENAIEEGIEFIKLDCNGYKLYKNHLNNETTGTAVESFSSLWQSINGEESWNSNPWVWVIEFERVEKPENFLA